MFKKLFPLLLLCSFELFAGIRLAPQANDDSISVIVGISPSISVNLTANDRYGSIVTFNGSTTGRYGFLSLSGTSATYTLFDSATNTALATGKVVTDTFTYTYANEFGKSASARLIVKVTGNQKRTPVANDDTVSVIVSVSPSITVDLASNDLYGSLVTIKGSTTGRYGFLRLSGTSATYTLFDNNTNANLPADQVVTDTFTYTYANDAGKSTTARLIVQVTGNQQAPVAVDDTVSLTVGVNASATVNLTSNDRYGSIVTIAGSTAGQYGFLLLDGSSATYTLYNNAANANLAAGQVVTDTFTYTYANEFGQSTTADLVVRVNGNQQAPVAVDDTVSLTVGINDSATVNLTNNDRFGNIVTIKGPTTGQYGFLLLSGSTATYTLYNNAANANLAAGQEVTDTFTYTYTNNLGQSATANLIVKVTGNQQAPVAFNDTVSLTVGVNDSATVNLTSNDRFGNIVTIKGPTTGQYGFLLLSGSTATYTLYKNTANANLAAGQVVTDTFTYTYTNDLGQSASADLIVRVTGNQQTPVAVDDTVSLTVGVNASVAVNLASNDRNGGIVTIAGSTTGQYGALRLSGSTATYTLYNNAANANLAADTEVTDTFTYTYANELGQSTTAKLIVRVKGNQQTPVAVDDTLSLTVGINTTATANLASNDRNGSIVTIAGSTTGQYGFLLLDGSSATYTLYNNAANANLAAGQAVTDTFTYTYANELGQSTTAKLIVRVNGNQQTPVAVDDTLSLTVGINTTATVNLTNNDRNGSIVTLLGSTTGQYGFLLLSGTSATYTLYNNSANANLSAPVTDTFTYTYANELGQSTTAKLIVRVNGNQQTPVAVDDTLSLTVGINNTSATVNLASNDRNGSIVTLLGSTTGQYGSLLLSGSTATYTLYNNAANANLAADKEVTDTFTYTYANELGQSTTAKLIVRVNGNQQTPVAVDDTLSLTVGINTSATVNLTNNDRNGSIVTLLGSTTGQYGSLLLSGSTATYTLYNNASNANLAADKEVTDTFTYTYANTLGQSTTARLIVRVSGNQQTPVAVDDTLSLTVGINTSATVNLTNNDRFGNIVTLLGSTAGQYGTLSLSGTSATYTLYNNSTNANLPAPVTDTFTYTYANTLGQSTTARLLVQVNGNQQTPVAINDNVTVLSNVVTTSTTGVVISNGVVTGNVVANDRNGISVYLNSLPASQYGNLVLNPNGNFTYTVYKDAPSINKLKAGEVVTDSFSYTYIDQNGQTAIASLNVNVIGNPVDANGNTIFEKPQDEPYDNVDVEFNDQSADATPLNSGRNIKGHLYTGEDKDWYLLHSDGDEIINLEVCPVGSSCFGKKNWVLYVFDGDRLAAANNVTSPAIPMEGRSYLFERWLDETGTPRDLSGQIILNSPYAASNHLYLAYRQGYFEGALIGIVDPCFDTSNSVAIGVGAGAKNYFIAISAPLEGSDDTGKPAGKCGVGSVILTRPGISVSGFGADGTTAQTYATTEEYVTVFPYSDDQYTIKITGTGLNPLLSQTAATRSATFNAETGVLNIPKIRVADNLYEASLALQSQFAFKTNSNTPLKFDLLGIQGLSPNEIADAFQATYNPATQQVMIPRVTYTVSGKAYSVILQYHPETSGNDPWLEVVDSTLIQ